MPETYLEIELEAVDNDERKIQVRTVGQSDDYDQLRKEWTQNWKG